MSIRAQIRINSTHLVCGCGQWITCPTGSEYLARFALDHAAHGVCNNVRDVVDAQAARNAGVGD